MKKIWIVLALPLASLMLLAPAVWSPTVASEYDCAAQCDFELQLELAYCEQLYSGQPALLDACEADAWTAHGVCLATCS
jgi:hypothetical protein